MAGEEIKPPPLDSPTSLANSKRGLRPSEIEKSSSGASLASLSSQEKPVELEDHDGAITCVYCAESRGEVVCNGCESDVYCSTCFRMIHRAGYLSTHSFTRIDHSAQASEARRSSSVSINRAIHNVTRPHVLIPFLHKADDVQSETAASPPPPSHTKSWEFHMDHLIQDLMRRTIYSQGDSSNHHSRASRPGTRNNSSTENSLHDGSPHSGHTPPSPTSQSLKGEGSISGRFSSGSQTPQPTSNPGPFSSLKLASESYPEKREATGAKQDREPAPSSNMGSAGLGIQHLRISPSSSLTTPTLNGPSLVAEQAPQGSASLNIKPKRSKGSMCGNCGGNHKLIDCPSLSLDSLGTSTTPAIAQAANAPIPLVSKPILNQGVEAGTDTLLRIKFTRLHNQAGANSTTAYLGDEPSVHAGASGFFAKLKGVGTKSEEKAAEREKLRMRTISSITEGDEDLVQSPSPSHGGFGPESLAMKEKGTMAGVERSQPLLPSLRQVSPEEFSDNNWLLASIVGSCEEKLLYSVFSDALKEVHETQRKPVRRSSVILAEGSPVASRVMMAQGTEATFYPRTILLRQNFLFEFLPSATVENGRARPIGCAHVQSAHLKRDTSVPAQLHLTLLTTAKAAAPRETYVIRFSCNDEATEWFDLLGRAANVRLDDLYDLNPYARAKAVSEVQLELGRGRFSCVRRARRKMFETTGNAKGYSEQKDCAIKIVDKNAFWRLVAEGRERNDTLYRELWIQSYLTLQSSPGDLNIVHIRGVFETLEFLVIEMEFMEGGDLFDIIEEYGPLREEAAAFLVFELLHAVEFCQRMRVVHRDVKLANLALRSREGIEELVRNSRGSQWDERELMRFRGLLKLADYGMSTFLGEDGTVRGRCGTPGYVAPEILNAGPSESYPAEVDMFSVGVVVYILLCAYEPFYGVNDQQLRAANKAVAYEFHSPEWDCISQEAKDLISKLLTKDPTSRLTPQDALQHPWLQSFSFSRPPTTSRELLGIDTDEHSPGCTLM